MVISPLKGTLRCDFKNGCHCTAYPYPFNINMPFGMLFYGWRFIAWHHWCFGKEETTMTLPSSSIFEGFFGVLQNDNQPVLKYYLQ